MSQVKFALLLRYIPCLKCRSLHLRVQLSPFSLFLYDATMLWMNVTDQMVKLGQNPRNGTAFAQIARQYTGQGEILIVKELQHMAS